MLQGPLRLAILAAALAWGAIGLALALLGAGVPFFLAAILPAAAVGLVQYAALRSQAPATTPSPIPDPSAQLDAYRVLTATLRHDLRGILSPALMMSDRLIHHADPAVQRAGNAVIRSIDRATAALSTHKDALAAEPPPPP